MTNLTDNVLVFKIELPSKDTKSLSVNEFHKDRREPYPKVIRVYEKQTVELFESKYYLSVYPTDSSTTIFGVNQNDIHYKSHEPTKSSSVSLVYGPYKDVAPSTFEQIQLFFTFPYPLPSFTEATRDIYVSHWGSIAIDEYFNLFNFGAGINGQFSRVDYMPHVNPSHGANAISSLALNLP